MPVINIDHAVAAIDFDDRSDERHHAIADRFDIRTVVNGQPIREFHQCCRRAGFRRMNRAGDVIDRESLIDEAVGFSIVHVDGARIGKLGKPRTILIKLRQQRL